MKALIERILNGDKRAFRTIVEQYDKGLLTLAFRFFNDWDVAKEVTHETFIKVYKKLNQYDNNRPFDPWLYRIHLNTCRSRYRKRKLRMNLFSGTAFPENVIRSQANIDDDFETIMNCINQLSWKQKTAFILMEIENFSSKEAGKVLDCKDGTVRVHLNRAKQNLRTKLKNIGFDYE